MLHHIGNLNRNVLIAMKNVWNSIPNAVYMRRTSGAPGSLEAIKDIRAANVSQIRGRLLD